MGPDVDGVVDCLNRSIQHYPEVGDTTNVLSVGAGIQSTEPDILMLAMLKYLMTVNG